MTYGQTNVMTIQVHASITKAEEENIDEFYDQDQFEIDRTCKQNFLLCDWRLECQPVFIWNIKMESVVGLYSLGNGNEAEYWLT